MKILKFSAVWCPACLIMNKEIKKIKEEYNIEIISYDYDIDEDKIIDYQIGKVLPVLIFLDENNKELMRLIGEHKKEEIQKILDRK